MKKLIILIVAAIGIFGCIKENPDFADYKYTSVYFPMQTPMRTLILGEYAQADNSLDNKLQFNLGVAIGGRRENYQDEWVKFEIIESMISGFVFSNGDTLKALPKKYYTTSTASGEKIVIPTGSMEGKVLVSLTPEFLSDPNAYKNRYVIPVQITEKSAGIDTILQGMSVAQNPNLLVAANWSIAPKNYTVFGIKYVNEYHGNYLHYGMDYTLDAAGNRLSTPAPVKYSTYFVEQNAIWKLSTTGRNALETSGVANSTSSKMKLTINTDNTVAIAPVSGAKVVDGTRSTGKFAKKGGKWGGNNYDALFLNYKYSESNVQHEVVDTLVFRDKGIVFETFSVKAK
ncbi:MAG: DUF5627 domain-containing protein [Prolixibacteraceae bacterium]|jgi:hypothetical protein|nr:DUF5627 domain-containing protein [Prolixibacteraceae bacterium]